MISRILQALESGMLVMRSNLRLLFVGVLVFIFPILFVWITQNFFSTAYDNIDTSEKRRVGLLHDSISSVLTSSSHYYQIIENMISVYSVENPDIVKIRVVEKDDVGFKIIFSDDLSQIGNYEKTDDAYRMLPLSGNDTLIVKTVVDGARTWQAFRGVELVDKDLFIFSEHSFVLIDSVMSARRQQSYFGLTAIFVFLIALAYWINRQTNWQKEHAVLVDQLKERDMFSNMIAHEFRSPLTAIKGYASFLEESKSLTKDERRFAGNIHKSAQRLVVLVSDFLEVARLQAGKLKIESKETDVRDILTTVAYDLEGMAKKKGLELVYKKGREAVLMTTDASRMIQVITNIVSNSVKYSDKGRVELVCVQTPGEVVIRVKDTGMGISADDQKKLFSPFTRVGGVDSGSTTGTGLGMWITQHLVILLGGTIGVESIKGVGTHIVITFKV